MSLMLQELKKGVILQYDPIQSKQLNQKYISKTNFHIMTFWCDKHKVLPK